GLLLLLSQQGVVPSLTGISLVTNGIIIASCAVLVMWIGELITEFGGGNGVSLLIFAGIVSRIPNDLGPLIFAFDPSQIPAYLGFIVAGAAIIAGVVFITEAERPIPVTYARRVRGMKV